MYRRSLIALALILSVFAIYQPATPPPDYLQSDVVTHSLPWAGQPLSAQASDFRGFQKTFVTQTATGATASAGNIRGIAINHTAELIVTGAPATCTYRLQGSRDGTTWFNISAADITCTATTVAFEANKPAVTVRGNLLTLTGGTSPSVTLKYIGR